MAGNSSRGVAETIGFAARHDPLDLLGFERCENVLPYGQAWRQVYAMAASCHPVSVAAPCSYAK
jgi:hypothetical protein